MFLLSSWGPTGADRIPPGAKATAAYSPGDFYIKDLNKGGLGQLKPPFRMKFSGWTGIGGWLAPEGDVRKETALWFSHEVTAADLPWAFDDTDPTRVVTPLELVGTYALVSMAGARLGAATTHFEISAGIDSRAGAGAVRKGYARTMPGAAVMIYLQALLRKLGARLRLQSRSYFKKT